MNAALIPVFAVVFLAISAAMFHHYVVRMYQVGEWLRKGAVLLDVDSAGEFALRHPYSAVSLPLEGLARRADELGSRDTSVVVFAHSWPRGARAVHELRGLGFRTVLNAAGLRLEERLGAAVTDAAEARRPPVLQRLGLTAEHNDVVAALVKQGERVTPDAGSDAAPDDLIFARILVPVDFSEGSRRALRTALALQGALGSEVHLFHVADVGADDQFVASIGASSTTPGELAYDSKSRLHRFLSHVCPGHSAEVSVHAHPGADLAVGIERVATEIRATLIVLGRGSTDALLRTHVEHIARHVDGAVLLV